MTSNGSEGPGAATWTAVGSISGLERSAWHEAERLGRVDLIELVAQVCAGQLGLAPVHRSGGATPGRWGGIGSDQWRALPDLSDGDRALLELAEQFTVDVSSVTDDQRSALFSEWGSEAAPLVAVVFAMDFLPRTWAALAAVGGEGLVTVRSGARPQLEGESIWAAMDRLIRAVPRLDALDPVTSELIRLRGARQHRCRLCQSLRSRPALLAGADEPLFDAVDDYESSRLSAHQKAALAVADAMIWTPGRLGSVAPRLVATSTPAQCIEVVVDVTRNALNKVAVALAADAAHVQDGLEIYDVGPDGDLVYGLTLE